MMERLFVDTNIIIDLLAQREPFYGAAAALFTWAEQHEAPLCISALCFNDLHYLFSRQYSKAASRRMLLQFKAHVHILAVDDKTISAALHSSFADLEDAIQFYTAAEHDCSVIITRNLKDFKLSTIPVMTAEMYMKGVAR